MLTLTYSVASMPKNDIMKIYKILHENDIPHDVIQSENDSSVFTIRCRESKKTYSILKKLGFN